jgi:CheY-like chemotaxis protein
MVHVLIIDDDEDDRDVLSDAIHELDAQIRCTMAGNGEEALNGLRVLQYPKPQLIFLDLNMPRLDGVQFIKELKKDRALSDIPVVVYTTSKWKEDSKRMQELGAVYFLTKPSNFKILCRSVQEIFTKELIHR